MSKAFTLYKAIKDLCPTNFMASFGSLDSKSEMSYAVYYNGGAPNDRVLDGRYLTQNQKVTINVHAGQDAASILSAYQFCEDVASALEKVIRHLYTDASTGESVTLLMVDIIDRTIHLGTNEFNIQAFSMNFRVTFC